MDTTPWAPPRWIEETEVPKGWRDSPKVTPASRQGEVDVSQGWLLPRRC